MWNQFWATFIDIWQFLSGHTGIKSSHKQKLLQFINSVSMSSGNFYKIDPCKHVSVDRQKIFSIYTKRRQRFYFSSDKRSKRGHTRLWPYLHTDSDWPQLVVVVVVSRRASTDLHSIEFFIQAYATKQTVACIVGSSCISTDTHLLERSERNRERERDWNSVTYFRYLFCVINSVDFSSWNNW